MSGSEANYGATDEEERVSIKAGSSDSGFGSVVTPSVRSLKVGGRFGSIHSLSGFGGSFVAGDGEEDLEEGYL